MYWNTDPVATVKFEYDIKRTPYDGTPLKPIMIKTDNNNKVKETVMFSGADVVHETIISYEYNANGYPVKSTANADGNQPQIVGCTHFHIFCHNHLN